MSMSVKELKQFRDNLERLKDKAPEVMEEILVGEGTYAVGQARSIVTNQKKVNTGAYRYNFHTGDRSRPAYATAQMHDGTKPRKQGKTWLIDVYNNLDYASYLEMGFRSHWVPGKYLSPTVLARVYANQKAKAVAEGKSPPKEIPMGIYVGPYKGYVNGIWALRTAMRRTEMTQASRIQRKFERIIKEELEKGL